MDPHAIALGVFAKRISLWESLTCDHAMCGLCLGTGAVLAKASLAYNWFYFPQLNFEFQSPFEFFTSIILLPVECFEFKLQISKFVGSWDFKN
jgi:hypothetical protein